MKLDASERPVFARLTIGSAKCPDSEHFTSVLQGHGEVAREWVSGRLRVRFGKGRVQRGNLQPPRPPPTSDACTHFALSRCSRVDVSERTTRHITIANTSKSH